MSQTIHESHASHAAESALLTGSFHTWLNVILAAVTAAFGLLFLLRG